MIATVLRAERGTRRGGGCAVAGGPRRPRPSRRWPRTGRSGGNPTCTPRRCGWSAAGSPTPARPCGSRRRSPAGRSPGSHSVPIGMDTEITATRPTELTRVDGESVYRVAKAQLYTSPAVLAAEARIVTAAGRTDGRRVRAADVELAELEWSANTRWAGAEHRAGRDGPGHRHQRPPGAAGVGAGRDREDHRDGGPRRRVAQRRRHRRRVGAAGQRRAGTGRGDPRGAGGHPGQTGARPHHPHPRTGGSRG